ncbi:MAG TPA: 4-alpha-glucanotransferase [Gammaproteobacteria bacterium]|nr:4-alpha-glucanotransferase [Gammaproteobacteria bacterium]
MIDTLLKQLADAAGIEPGYTDTWGNRHETRPDTQRAVLKIVGLPADDETQIRASLDKLQASERQTPPLDIPAAPAWRPDALRGNGRRWGIQVPLYGLRSPRNWGIGDFTDLAELVKGAAELGAAAVGLNPLHALFPSRPGHISPYSPSSRLFLNPLYVDVEAVPEFTDCAATHRKVNSPVFQARLRELRDPPLVDYRGVAELKFAILEELYGYFRKACADASHPRHRAFREFQTRRGDALLRFATFHALAEQTDTAAWRDWPHEWCDPESDTVAVFVERHIERVEFHEYLQWQADWQLRAAAELARESGMSVGLYTDLAVGADPTGAEAWGHQKATVQGASVGAPPDQLNLQGQDWGLPPPDPLAWQAQAYAPFIELLEANMRHAGAIRIDHILGLVRLYWIPAGMSAKEGAYVRYPWRDLLAVLAAQSRRSRCLVIGEDLGTVPEGLREAMMENGILSYRLLYFERDDGSFRAPRDYPAEALAAVGTHDLPTLPGWWHSDDIALRDRLDLWPSKEKRNQACAERERDRQALMKALHDTQLVDEATMPEEPPVMAIYRYLAQAPSRLLMVQLEDVLGQREQLNLPGTTDEYPNWRQRMHTTIDSALSDPRMLELARALKTQGRADAGHRLA